MRNNRVAFTLIEVMVVLSVLAIIAILGYNFFGSVSKEALLKNAVTGHGRNIAMIRDAWEEYERVNGTRPANFTTFKAWAVDSGYLKSWPSPPAGSNGSAYNGGISGDYGGPTVSSDYVLYSTGISYEECAAINKHYNPSWPWTADWVVLINRDVFGSNLTPLLPHSMIHCTSGGGNQMVKSLLYHN